MVISVALYIIPVSYTHLDVYKRQVHIRLLVDGMESWIDMEGNPYFYGLSSHENVEIKLYNKANPLKPWKMMVECMINI